MVLWGDPAAMIGMFGRCNYPYVRICICVLLLHFLRDLGSGLTALSLNSESRTSGAGWRKTSDAGDTGCGMGMQVPHTGSFARAKISDVIAMDMISFYTTKNQINHKYTHFKIRWLGEMS